jgi:signal peptidase II
MREQTPTTQVKPTTAGSYRWLFWCLALLGLSLDQWSKYAVFSGLYLDGRENRENKHELVANVFALSVAYTYPLEPTGSWRDPLRSIGGIKHMPRVNHGALWGLGGRNHHDEPGSDFNAVFAIISLLAALAIGVWSTRPAAARDRFLCISLGLILAGTLGNLYDRVVFNGVRDFLSWYYLYDFPVFNIADCCLVCGAFFLLLQAFFSQPHPVDSPALSAAAAIEPAAEQAVPMK